MKKIKIAPSILSADFARAGEEVANITRDGADVLHIDIMDGSFVKNISFGPKFVKEIRPYSKAVFDCHLMIVNPWNYIKQFADAGADIITVHYEACGERLAQTLQEIKPLGIPSEKESILGSIDWAHYAQQQFGMYSGKKERVTLRFINPLLDTVIDKFGRDNLYYQQVDETHFSVQVEVAITDQFFGWLCSLGRTVKIVSPPHVQEKYKQHLEKIKDMY
jgi:hypothetical protein